MYAFNVVNVPSLCDLLIAVTQSRSMATLMPIEDKLSIEPKTVMNANVAHAPAGAW